MRNSLFVFGRFTDDAQRILAAVRRLAFVGFELCLNIGILELSIAPFACANGWMGLFYDPQFTLRHDCSLAHPAGRV